MNNEEWQQIGEDIKRQVQDAIDAGDFSKLSKTIGDTVGLAIDGMGKSINEAVGGVGKSFNEAMSDVGKGINEAVGGIGKSLNGAMDEAGRSFHDVGGNGRRGMDGAPGRPGAGFAALRQDAPSRDIRRMKPNLRPDRRFFRKPSGNVSGIVFMALGFSLCGIAGFFTFISVMLFLFGGESILMTGVFGFLAAAGLGLGLRGITLKERAGRFKRYVSVVGQKLYCSIEELAGRTGRNQKFVLKDIKKMMRRGWFIQGHLDKQESCLIVSDEIYEQYRLTQSNYENQQRLKEEQQGGQKPYVPKEQDKLSKYGQTEAKAGGVGNVSGDAKDRTEYEKMLEEGQEYIRMIRLCNDEIPGEEMSGKLDKLELLVTRIFGQVEKEPELAPDLHKMLNYYLPTTQKLLEAYRDLEKQNLELTNISATKKEIEETVDTINQAFEKFLDELFREKAWDIQSDISVLHTMLKQDGYLKGDFEK